MSPDGQLILEIVLGVVTLAGSIIGLAKWILHRIEARIARLERERAESEAALRSAATDSENRCREENAAAGARIRELEKRAHDEGRQDRERLFQIVAQGAEANRQAAVAAQQASNVTASVIRSLDKIADRLPDQTPPKGAKTT